jgi:hypothetical protein
MPTCLYCQECKDCSGFNREHVIPQAFGTFEQNLVLVNTVCADCNTHFGKHLDLKLSRDSIEGLERYEHGIKRPSSKTAFGQDALLKARINDGGFYQGAEVWWGPSQDGTKLVLYPFPQIGVSDGVGHQEWFPADQIPTKSQLHDFGFVPGAALTIKPLGVESSAVEGELCKKGYAPSPVEHVQGPPEEPDTEIYISGIINHTLNRAIAKIAFNYFAYHFHSIAMMEQFDEIRRYVRYEQSPSSRLVSLSSKDFLAGLPEDKVPVAHGVAVSWKAGQVIGQVTLFFRFHYRILVANGGFLIAPTDINKGHLFNPISKQILELTSDPRRGRSLPSAEEQAQ